MYEPLPNEDTPHVLALAIVTWAAAVALGALEGVFARLSESELAALAIFALTYAPVQVLFDRELRAWLAARDARWIGAALAALVVIVCVALLHDAPEAGLARLARPSAAMAVFFAAPLAAALAVAALGRAAHAAPPVTTAPAKSPGGKPAAT